MRPHFISSIVQEQNLTTANRNLFTEEIISQFCRSEIELDRYLVELMRLKKILNGTEIWPDQCNYAVHVLRRAQEPTEELSSLLKSMPSLTLEITLNRYSFLSKLNYTNIAISDIIMRFTSYLECDQSDLSRKSRELK